MILASFNVPDELATAVIVFLIAWMFKVERRLADIPWIKNSLAKIERRLGCESDEPKEKAAAQRPGI
jgi:hypothetical protein